MIVEHFGGIDLHSNNVVLVIIDQCKRWVFKRRMKNDLSVILEALCKFRGTLVGIVVESTYNWYWVVDGLMDNGYKMHLAHPVEISTKSRKKYSDDYRDAFKLADLLLRGELHEGYIYPKEDRGLRDLLRKRGMLVKSRAKYIQNLGNFVNQQLGIQFKGYDVKTLGLLEFDQMFVDELLRLSGRSNLAVIKTLNLEISKLEKAILEKGKLKKEFHALLAIPGIGNIISLAISLETGAINRFPDGGDYVSYSRCAPGGMWSNEKKKGEGNRKNGNKYLDWAYTEAANFTIRRCPYAKAYFDKKLKRTGERIVAIKSVAGKLARGVYCILTRGVEYDPEKLFGVHKVATPVRKPKKTYKGVASGSKPKRGLGKKPTV